MKLQIYQIELNNEKEGQQLAIEEDEFGFVFCVIYFSFQRYQICGVRFEDY